MATTVYEREIGIAAQFGYGRVSDEISKISDEALEKEFSRNCNADQS